MVRLYQGDYDQKTGYSKSPHGMAQYYQSIGLTHIHVVDLNGAVDAHLVNSDVIRSILDVQGITIQVGGGIRTMAHAQTLFELGVTNIIIGSLLFQNFELTVDIINAFPGKVIIGLDLKNGAVATNGWTTSVEDSLTDIFDRLNPLPIHSIVSTDISRDGTFTGLNTELYSQLDSLSTHSIVASGGVSTIKDIIELESAQLAQLSGCIVGKAIIEDRITPSDVHQFLAK